MKYCTHVSRIATTGSWRIASKQAAERKDFLLSPDVRCQYICFLNGVVVRRKKILEGLKNNLLPALATPPSRASGVHLYTL